MNDNYLDVSDNDGVSVAVENILAIWVSINDQGHPSLSTGECCKHTLCRNRLYLHTWTLLYCLLTTFHIAKLTWLVRHGCKSTSSENSTVYMKQQAVVSASESVCE